MNTERDKFLSEKMGQCCTFNPDHNGECLECDCWYSDHIPTNFSTWEGFGKLKEFMCNHPRHESFYDNYLDSLTENAESISETFSRISPNEFADAVYGFLQESDDE